MRHSSLLLAALAVWAPLFAADPVDGKPATPPVAADAKPAPKIAVLRLGPVLRSSKLFQAGSEKFKKEQAEANAARKAIEEQLQKLDGQLQVLKPDNANYASIFEELKVLEVKRDITNKRINAELERRQVTLVKSVFTNAQAKLAEFCRERGIMIVHLAPEMDLSAGRFEDIQLELGLKSVLYFDPAMDITEAFIPYLNAAEAAAANPPAAPVAPAKP